MNAPHLFHHDADEPTDPATPDGWTAAAILDRLRELGVTLTAEPAPSDRLLASGRVGAIGAALRDAITAARPRLRALLLPRRTYPCAGAGCVLFVFHVPGVTCWWCRTGRTPPTLRPADA